MKIGIVMPCRNFYEGALKALESVKTSHSWTPFIQPQWRVNLPLSQAWNNGVNQAAAAGCDYALVINDDILFAPETIDTLVSTLASFDENVVMVTASNVAQSISEHDIYNFYHTSDSFDVVESPDFSCFLVRTDILSKVGLFDQNFIPAYFEDNDYHYRINLLGLKALRTTAAPYFHHGSKTQSIETTITSSKFEANREYYISKWGGSPGQETFLTPYNDPVLTPKEWLQKR